MNTAVKSRSSVQSTAFPDANTYLSGICFIWIHYNNRHLQEVSWDLHQV